MIGSDKPDAPARSRVRWTLLALLWVWAILVFVVIDLFLNVEEFDRIRPGGRTYRGMRMVAHDLVGEKYEELEQAEVAGASTPRSRSREQREARRPVQPADRKSPRLPPALRTDERLGYVEHGTFTQWNDPSGEQGEGDYKAGRRVGRWTWTYPDGQLQEERHYEKGLLQGRVASFYEDGSKERLELYAKNKRDGEWKAWHPNGQQAALEQYDAGKPSGEFARWDESGQKLVERRFDAGVAEGAMTVWHPNGKRKLTGTFVGGKKDGRWSYYDAAGNHLRDEEYRQGKRVRSGG